MSDFKFKTQRERTDIGRLIFFRGTLGQYHLDAIVDEEALHLLKDPFRALLYQARHLRRTLKAEVEKRESMK